MSRTKRRHDLFDGVFSREVKVLKTGIDYLLRTKDVGFFINECRNPYFLLCFNNQYKNLIPLSDAMRILKLTDLNEQYEITLTVLNKELKRAIKDCKTIQSDRRNWSGNIKRNVKQYSKQKSRSGKKNLISNIIKKVDLSDLESLDDKALFVEKNLDQIKMCFRFFD